MISQDFITNRWSLGGFAQYVWPLMNTIIRCRTIFIQKNIFSSCLLRKNRFWQHKCCISQSTVVFVALLAFFTALQVLPTCSSTFNVTTKHSKEYFYQKAEVLNPLVKAEDDNVPPITIIFTGVPWKQNVAGSHGISVTYLHLHIVHIAHKNAHWNVHFSA